jgi:hypothetical protein
MSACSASSSKTRKSTTAQYGNHHQSEVSGNGNSIGNISSAFTFTDAQAQVHKETHQERGMIPVPLVLVLVTLNQLQHE